ncbi:S9 family peptidase [Crateriforma conspicua]|uniref:Prolyl tripeptidyl peptidase n=1 Tax=Crateriforma conspicua TaxID=2527996 RepID=A0A5C5Y5E4_9PLAN|nr:S9 family peptidase [Crateriforma conspicua]TWT70149.1 Prolyl tripeptidyl peptidase precursor [Crateriforma conspicua]
MTKQRWRVAFGWLVLWPVLAAGTLQAQSEDRGSESGELRRFSPADVAKVRYVTNAKPSPDGSQVAYLLSVPRRPMSDDNGPAWTELHVVDRDGQTRPFVTGHVNVSSTAWSHDGSAIYFVAKRTGDDHSALYRIAIDGGEAIRVLTHETGIGSYSLSPDGESIAFLATKPVPEDEKKLRDQGFDQEIYEEDVSATLVWLSKLPTVNDVLEGKDDAQAKPLELPGSASQIHFSPSGKELAVVLAPTPLIDDHYMAKKVHIADAESGQIIREIEHVGKLGQVAWSPDGKRLALVGSADIHDPHEGRLVIADVVSGDADQPAIRDLMPEDDSHVESIAWIDDTTLVYSAAEGVSSRLGTVTIDGQRNDWIEPGGELVIDAMTKAADANSFVLVGESANHPPDVFAVEKQGDAPERLTISNPWLSEMRFARQEPIRWTAADGLELEGVLMYPLNYVQGRQYPTIMYVHGGPESHESNAWLTSYARPGQTAAAMGFAVFYPNYRGSTGRGVEFSMMGQADAAGKEFSDLIDGVDHLIDIGITKPDAVGITGGSYGGFASAWGTTYYSDRFAASVMFVGISDNVSKVGTTDIPEEMFLVHHRKRLWDDWDYFLESSPIYHVQKNRTPTLILHGKNDPRVHPSQSLELFRHLKTLDQAPVRLVMYEGEGHGNRKAAARLDYNLRMLRWMQEFLQKKSSASPPLKIDYQAALGEDSSNP